VHKEEARCGWGGGGSTDVNGFASQKGDTAGVEPRSAGRGSMILKEKKFESYGPAIRSAKVGMAIMVMTPGRFTTDTGTSRSSVRLPVEKRGRMQRFEKQASAEEGRDVARVQLPKRGGLSKSLPSSEKKKRSKENSSLIERKGGPIQKDTGIDASPVKNGVTRWNRLGELRSITL